MGNGIRCSATIDAMKHKLTREIPHLFINIKTLKPLNNGQETCSATKMDFYKSLWIPASNFLRSEVAKQLRTLQGNSCDSRLLLNLFLLFCNNDIFQTSPNLVLLSFEKWRWSVIHRKRDTSAVDNRRKSPGLFGVVLKLYWGEVWMTNEELIVVACAKCCHPSARLLSGVEI